MSELRITRAGPHALTLLVDIRENAQRLLSDELITLLFDDFHDLHEHASECSIHYFIGFENHFPYGYVKVSLDDGEGEIAGPYSYAEYSDGPLQTALLAYALDFCQKHQVRLVYSLNIKGILGAAESYLQTGFEDISDDSQFIKRWHGGILADRVIPPGTQLFARLLEIEDLPIGSE